MDELKSLVESLKREIKLLEELVKAKDDLIQQLKFSPAPIIIRETQVPVLQPYIQPIITPVAPWNPPYVVTSGIGTNPDQSGQVLGHPTSTFLSLVKAK